jgi:hypothetical protein
MLKSELNRAELICRKLSTDSMRLRVVDVSPTRFFGYTFAIQKEAAESVEYPNPSFGSYTEWKAIETIETADNAFSDDLEAKCVSAMSR